MINAKTDSVITWTLYTNQENVCLCLSRMANPVTCEEDESLNLQITSIEQEQCINLSEVKQTLVEDPVSILLGDLIVNGWPDSCKELENELKPYWIHRFHLSLVDGVILLGEDCIVIPITLCEKFHQCTSLYTPRHY